MSASAFAGCVAGASPALPGSVLAGMLGSPCDACSVHQGEGWALAIRGRVPALDVEPLVNGGVLLCAGAPRLGGEHAQRVLREAGATPAPSLEGSFLVLRITAAEQPGLEALTDAFASYPFYYAEVDGALVFGSTPAVVARHPAVADTVSPQSLYDFLYMSAIPSPMSVFSAVQSLTPGTRLELRGARVITERYRGEAFEPRPLAGEHERGQRTRRLRECLRECVGRQLEDAVSGVGCFLSGGIDSSSVVGMVRECTGEAPATFSIGFSTDEYDELDYARLVARHFGARHHEYIVTVDDVLDLLPRVVTAYGQPFGNSSVVPTYHCAVLAREHGVDRLLAGDGGDELFGGNERYSEQLVFGLYDRLPAWARKGLVEPVLVPLLSAMGGFTPARKAVSYVRQAGLAMPDRLERYNYLRLIGESRILSAELLSMVDPSGPLALKREVYEAVRADGMLNRMLGLDFKFTLADSDLPKVRTMCALSGTEVRFPFLEPELVAFASQLPESEKATPRRLRTFFKEASRGFLPEEVIRKKKHGFGLPFGVWVTEHRRLRERVYALLDGLAARGVARREFVTELQDRLLPEQPRYFGPLAWNLIVLEGWLEAHGDSFKL